MPDKLYKTGEVLKRTGLSREVFYRYLNIGLIKEAARTPGGHNLFDETVFARLDLIRQLNHTGYPLRDIREIFFKDGEVLTHVDPKKMKIILASASLRRAQLLADAGYQFEVRAPSLREEDLSFPDKHKPRSLAMGLAYAKARCIADDLTDGIVLGADTIVCLGDEIIGKPANHDEARAILSKLSGSTHSVVTGVCVFDARRGERLMDFEETFLRMKNLTEQELEDYVNSGEGIGKAGAYAIQESGDRYVQIVKGSLTNVIGLPMDLTERLLEEMLKLIRHG